MKRALVIFQLRDALIMLRVNSQIKKFFGVLILSSFFIMSNAQSDTDAILNDIAKKNGFNNFNHMYSTMDFCWNLYIDRISIIDIGGLIDNCTTVECMQKATQSIGDQKYTVLNSTTWKKNNCKNWMLSFGEDDVDDLRLRVDELEYQLNQLKN